VKSIGRTLLDTCVRLVVGLLVGVGGVAGASAESRVSGYVKNYSFVQDEIDFGSVSSDTLYSSQFSGRLMLDILDALNVGQARYSFQLHYELGREFNSDDIGSLSFTSRNTYRLTDLEAVPGDTGNKSRNQQNLDRFNVQVNLDGGDLTIGRQPITFGAARIINPTDIFLPFDVQTLNTEYRVGIDAIRFQRPIGQLSELDIGFVLGDDGTDNSAAFGRLKSNLRGSDFEFTFIRFSRQSLFGFGIETTLGQFGSWLETAVVSGDEDYSRTSLGLDYGFNARWFGMLEYHYNGAGADDPADYLNLLPSTPYQAGGVFLLGKHYLLPSLSWQVSPLATVSLQLIANLEDESLFTNLSADFSLNDNLYLGLSYFGFSGDKPGLTNLNSEYGSNPDRLIASLRFYF
jgi:hypothetical protein